MSSAKKYTDSVTVGICCVHYCDFLRHTLQRTLRVFSDVTVITSASDTETVAHTRSLGAKIWSTNVWFANGAAFNKSAAINEWLATRAPRWTLLLDADILLPDDFDLDVGRLDSTYLYSIPRRICENEWDWVRPAVQRPDYPLLIPPVKNGKVWRRPTTNPAALSGYFHLWDRDATGRSFYPSSPTAAEYDVEFALQFPESKREYLHGSVIHLGPMRENWNGRVSTPWSLTPDNIGLLPDSLKAEGADRIYRFKNGSRNPTYLCVSPTQSWVYRTVPPDFAWQVAKETYIYQTLRHIPTPKVLSISAASYIMDYGGTTAEGLRFLPQSFFMSCGKLLRRLHEESLDPNRLCQSRYAKVPWDEMFGYHFRLVQCTRWLGRIPHDSPVIGLLSVLLDRMRSDTSLRDAFSNSRFCFTHGDFKTANLLTDGFEPVNVIDFEHSIYGDPDSDLHWFCQRALSEGYSAELLRMFLTAYDVDQTFAIKRTFYRYFRAFQKVILTPPKHHESLVEWLKNIHDGSDPYLQCVLV